MQKEGSRRVALVTGGSGGIGSAVAGRLARDGIAVAVVYGHRRDAAIEVCRAIRDEGGLACEIQADITRGPEVRRTFDECESRLGPPDIVCALAGNMLTRSMAQLEEADFEAGFAVNVKGSMLTFAEAARRVPRGGRIIGCSSSLVRQGRPGISLYVAGKAAVEQMVFTLAKELGERGITVNAVAPGPTNTGLLSEGGRATAPQMTPLGRVAEPSEIAEVVAFLASPQGGWVNGQVIGVNGGIV